MRGSSAKWVGVALIWAGLAACDFGDLQMLVAAQDMELPVGGVAMSDDGSVLWAGAQGGPGPDHRVRMFDAATGSPLGAIGAGWSGEWIGNRLAPAREAGFEDNAWVMHLNGYRTRWSPIGGLTAFSAPVDGTQFPADTRSYNGNSFVTAADGAHLFATTESLAGAYTQYIYRHAPDGSWTRIESPGSLFHMAYDERADLLAVYDVLGYGPSAIPVMYWVHPSELKVLYEAEVPDGPTGAVAFAIYGGVTAWVDWDGLLLLDASGKETDHVDVLNYVADIALYQHGTDVRLVWSGADEWMPDHEYSAGWFELEEHVP